MIDSHDPIRAAAEAFLAHRYWTGEWHPGLFEAWADEVELPIGDRKAVETEARRVEAIDAVLKAGGENGEAATEARHRLYEFIGRLSGAYPVQVVRLHD